MSVRRAFNLVRQSEPVDERMTFEEFSIVCRLKLQGSPMKTSDIDAYQNALRPTMTDRTNHLFELGLIDRGEGASDRRNVVCSVTGKGADRVDAICAAICENIPAKAALCRAKPDRIRMYVDAMGPIFVKAGDLVILGLFCAGDDGASITQLVDSLGLLQPTVSMSVASLVRDGMVVRAGAGRDSRTVTLKLTDAGTQAARELVKIIEEATVRRAPRSR